MSIYLYSSSAISTIDNSSVANLLESALPINQNKTLVEPVYKEFINPMQLRRMGKATKMSIACSLGCLKKANDAIPEAIIMGTGLGAITDTEKFLKIASQEGNVILPPTSFIQSGHNSMAGQIALLLKNDSYNITHVQQGISFEYALQDAVLTVQEGAQLVLVGAADENTPLLHDLAERLNLEPAVLNQLSEGAAFFTIGSSKKGAIVKITAVAITRYDKLAISVLDFLTKHGLGFEDISNGFVGLNFGNIRIDELPFETIIYTDYIGRFFSSSAVGLYLACNYLTHAKLGSKYSIVINIASNNKLGLILIERV